MNGKKDMRMDKLAKALICASAAILVGGAAVAQELVGIPRPNGMGFQPAATELARDLHWLDGFLNYIMLGIVILVTGLLVFVALRFNEKANPTPARFTHNALVEVLWTGIPIAILVVIAAPSLNLLHKQVILPETAMTIKAVGNQWYWSYEYPDEEIIFDSLMVGSGFKSLEAAMADERTREQLIKHNVTKETWLLQTDTEVVVPIGVNIRLLVTGADVIHSWTIPAFGVKMDAVPGRLNETWFNVEREGIYYGQCSELCGQLHAYMPIAVRAVTPEAYAVWLTGAKELYASNPGARSVDVASAD